MHLALYKAWDWDVGGGRIIRKVRHDPNLGGLKL